MFTLVSQFLALSEDSWPEIPGRAKYRCGAHGNVTFFLRQDCGGQRRARVMRFAAACIVRRLVGK